MMADQDVETGDEKDNQKRREQYSMKEQAVFISRSYIMCTLLFFISGAAMVTAVLQGNYRNVVLAESIMVTVFGTIYILLLAIMCFCKTNDTLKVAILLFLTGFIGVVSGFMVAINLKTVVNRLKDSN